MTPRIGLIGPGAIAELHAEALAALGVPLVAVAGVDLESAASFAARHGGARPFSDVSTMLDAVELDAVVVASPSQLHVAHTLQALERGLYVLCEVPLALSLEDGERVARATPGRRVMVAHTLRFTPAHQRLYDELRLQRSEVRQIVARRLQLRQTDTGWTGRPRDWSDNVVWHHAAHLVDLALWLLGTDTVDVQGLLGPTDPARGAPMDVGMVLSTSTLQLASISLSYNSRVPANDVVAICQDASYEIRDGILRDATGAVLEGGTSDSLAAVLAQDRHFVRSVVEGRDIARPSLADALAVLRVLDAVSDRSGGASGGPSPGR